MISYTHDLCKAMETRSGLGNFEAPRQKIRNLNNFTCSHLQRGHFQHVIDDCQQKTF